MRISQAVKSLIHGVSTNDALQRNPVFLEAQHNMLTASASGLHKRPPTILTNLDFSTDLGTGAHHLIVPFRIKNKNFWFIATAKEDGTLVYSWAIYDLTGTAQTINLDFGVLETYLQGALKSSDITIAVRDDRLFITNKTKVVSLLTAVPSDTVTTGLGLIAKILVVKAPVEDQTIKFTWSALGTQRSASVKALGPSLNTRGTDQIAVNIAAAINAQTVANDLRASAGGSTVILYSSNGTSPIEVAVEDNANGTTAIGINEEIKSVAQLPRNTLINDIIAIRPSDDSTHTIYMKALRDGQALAALINIYPVHWREMSHPDQEYRVDTNTMPQALSFDGTSFTIVGDLWEWKGAGDNESNPKPAFIGTTITKLDVFQSRLVAISGENVQTTETIDSEVSISWWRDTVSQLLPTHPVQMNSTSEDSSDILHTVKHNKDLLLFADNIQLKLDGSVPLTPETSGLPTAANYANNTTVAPISVGSEVLFATTAGNHAGIFTYEAGNQTSTQDRATALTEHIKTYLPKNPLQIIASSELSMIFVIFTDAIYVCDSNADQTENNRLAWGKWELFSDGWFLPLSIASVVLENSTLYIIQHVESFDKVTLVTIDIQTDPSQEDLVYSLDWQQEITLTTGQDTITVDSHYKLDDLRVIEKSTGARLQHTLGVNTIILDSPVAGSTDIVYGHEYECYIIPSQPVIRDASGIVNRYANLGITSWTADLVNSAEVYADIITSHHNYDSQLWSGLLTFNIDSQVGVTASNSTEFTIGFNQPADLAKLKLWSKGHLPMNLIVLDWLGKYTQRGRRF